jgi:ATP-dependent Clp protease ATP-binding subunit ClpC
MFERFTDRARRVVVLSQEHARLLGHSYIGTEHVLLGLIHEGEGVAAKVLTDLGVSLDAVRNQVEEIIGQGGTSPSGNIPFTPRVKKVIEYSLREGLHLGHNYIGTEHLLLGLIREGEGVAAQILTSLGLDLSIARQKVIQTLSGQKPPASRYLRSPIDPEAYIDAAVPGVDVLLEHGWTLVERHITKIACPGCGHAHQCDRMIEVAA